MKRNEFFGILIILLWSNMLIFGDDNQDIDKEILRIRKELTEVSSQRLEVKNKSMKDYNEHEDYRKRMRKRITSIENDIDSSKESRLTINLQNDSIAALIRTETTRQHQYELMQEVFRKKLIELCGVYNKETYSVPPLSAQKLRTTLSFLQSELKTKNIDFIEGLQRLTQISKDFSELTSSIQITQSSSPLPEIRGTVYRVRIGCIYEAVVDAQATKYALWSGIDSSGNTIWDVHSDPGEATTILTAANIREGKALPAFAQIPLTFLKENSK